MILKNIIKVPFLFLLVLRPFVSAAAFPLEDIFWSFFFMLACLLVSKNTTKTLQHHPCSFYIKLLLLAICLSTLLSSDPTISLVQFYRFAVLLFAFFAVAGMETSLQNTIILILLITGTGVSIEALFWYVKGSFYTFDALRSHHIQWDFAYEYLSRCRAFTPFILPSSLGSYLILFTPLSFVFLYRKDAKINPVKKEFSNGVNPKNVLALIGILAIISALLATQSLGAIFSLVLALTIAAYQQKEKWIKKSLVLSLIFLLGVGVALFFLRTANAHFFNLPFFSLTNRVSYWKHALGVIAQHPFVGVGLGHYPFFKSTTPHNVYLQFWAETGLLGVVAIVGLAFQTIKANVRMHSPWEQKLYQALWIGNLAFLIHNFFDFTLMQPEVALEWWVVAALLTSQKRKPNLKEGISLKNGLYP